MRNPLSIPGLYLHIPFCKQKCSYCDFHFSTDLSYRERMLKAMTVEMHSKIGGADRARVETIYFGGGTPSLLVEEELVGLMETIQQLTDVSTDVEVTLEANPDDITEKRLGLWKKVGVNRLSIGIQSFDDADLQRMNRAHDALEAERCIPMAQAAGFDNITVDMIYGLPSADMAHFEKNLERFIALDVDHISAYNLTIEQGTLFHHLMKKGELELPEEEAVAERFVTLRDCLAEVGYEQYEVSNFARKGMISKHNSAYWLRKPYVGIGPSAHSYNGASRSWNVANNARYMIAVETGASHEEIELLSAEERYNDYILTRLRTKWGIDLKEIMKEFGVDLHDRFSDELEKYSSFYSVADDVLVLNSEGLLRADGIASDFFIVT